MLSIVRNLVQGRTETLYKIPNIFALTLLEQGFEFIKEDLDVTDEEPEDGDEVDTDYTQLEDDTIDTADEESGDEVNDTVEDETTTDEQQGNDTVDENDPEADPATDEEETGTDYTDMGNDETTGEEGTGEEGIEGEEGGDTSSEGEEGEVPEELSGTDTEDKSKRYYLLKDFVTLFSIVKEGYKAVSTAKTYDTNKMIVLKKVSENLEVLQDYMYMYLTQVFDKSSYIENLTNYNFFSSSLSANIKMIKDVNELSTYVQE